APKILDSLDGEVTRISGLIEAGAQAQPRLDAYAAASTDSVKGNLESARAKLKDAQSSLADGHKAVTDGKLPTAALAAANTQKDLADASALSVAVTNLADSLDAAAKTLQAHIDDADKDIATARATAAKSIAPGTADSFTKAEAALKDARALSAGPKP